MTLANASGVSPDVSTLKTLVWSDPRASESGPVGSIMTSQLDEKLRVTASETALRPSERLIYYRIPFVTVYLINLQNNSLWQAWREKKVALREHRTFNSKSE